MTFTLSITDINGTDSPHQLDTLDEALALLETLIGFNGCRGEWQGSRMYEPNKGALVVRDWISRRDGNAYAILTSFRLGDILDEAEIAALSWMEGTPQLNPDKPVALRVRREVFSSVNDASLGYRAYVLHQFDTYDEAEARFDEFLPDYQGPDETLHLSIWAGTQWQYYERRDVSLED